jgi:hypothetical protein
MKDDYLHTDQHHEMELRHLESQQWASDLHFIKDEIIFIGHLLEAYIFEPDTPNLFERLQDYRERLKKITDSTSRAIAQIGVHDNLLGGMLECKDEAYDATYLQKHEQLKAEVTDLRMDFQTFKLEIFNYAGGILKKRKPIQ